MNIGFVKEILRTWILSSPSLLLLKTNEADGILSLFFLLWPHRTTSIVYTIKRLSIPANILYKVVATIVHNIADTLLAKVTQIYQRDWHIKCKSSSTRGKSFNFGRSAREKNWHSHWK